MQDSTEKQEEEMNLKENLKVGWVSMRMEERECLKKLRFLPSSGCVVGPSLDGEQT